ncbi:MAG: ribosome small subunit-dependent GTPase A [Gemmatimonadetes bacterium]|nr:ribosome small subunit-dependent GTPase A [Gemmatimonadota bacterium]
MLTGTVRRTGGGLYQVALDEGRVVTASLRGRLKRGGGERARVVIGDRVQVKEHGNGTATLEGVLPRLSEVVRRGPGGRGPKLIAANLDRLVVVVAVRAPEPPSGMVDRLLAVGAVNRIESVLVVNKADLADPAAVEERFGPYRRIGYSLVVTSVVSGEGLDALRALLSSGTSALIGPSGAGKSSLLNAIEPGLRLRTGELSRKRLTGRQTTVNAVLLPLSCGGFVVDTPGFNDVGVWGVSREDLGRCFPEFERHGEACRFGRSCVHLHEPECGVKQAVAAEAIARSRYESYCRLLEEARGADRAW